VRQDQWLLESLQISCLETGHICKFSCGQWLGDKHRKEVEWRRDPNPTPQLGGLTLVDEGMASVASQRASGNHPQTCKDSKGSGTGTCPYQPTVSSADVH
jgi:hypothetical protein